MKKAVFLVLIVFVVLLISAGCTQQEPAKIETETITGTIKDIRFFPEDRTHEEIFQIIFEDGTWIIIEEYSMSLYPSSSTDATITDISSLKVLKIGETYNITFQKYDFSFWEVVKIEKT